MRQVEDFIKKHGPNVHAEIIQATIVEHEKEASMTERKEENLEDKISRLIDERLSERMSTGSLSSLPTERSTI